IIGLCLGFLGNRSFFSYAENPEEETVKVAYFDVGDYYQEQEDGSMKSYDAAYLDMISKYTGLKFSYVNCHTWDQALEMMRNHEIDLVGTMQWTQEREDQYEICDANYGYTIAELAALADSPYIYEDYAEINGATVGYMKGYVIGDKLQKLMEEKNLHFQFKTYENQQELDQALKSREIDLAAMTANAVHSDWKIVEKFAYAPFYFASWKGNEALTDKISQAIIRINIHQADFDDQLIREYFPVMVNSPYNKEEMDCINENETYRIYLDPQTKPLVWYDRESREMKGVLVNVCEQLSRTTGLHFEIIPKTQMGNDTNSEDTLVTYRTLYYKNDMNADLEEGVTDSILDQSFALYHRVGEDYQTDGAYSIAVVKDRDGLYEYLRDAYPNCVLQEYDTPEKCLMQVAEKRADITFVNTHIANNFIIEDNLNKLIDVPMSEVTFGIALQFHGDQAQLLSEIVDKGTKLVDSDMVGEAMLQYAIQATPKVTLTYLLQQHFNLVLIWVLVFIVILLICLSLLIYAYLMKKERNRMEEINRERTDFFARMSHDMRTPMNGIMGMLELTDQTSDLAEIRNNTKKAKMSGKYMLSLINDTLDLQRLESKKLTLEPQYVYVRDFLDNITEMITPSAERKGIQFIVEKESIDEEYYIRIDQVRVKQIFINILSNAVKFTPENGMIKMSIQAAESCDGQGAVKITIADTGIGMTKEFIENSLYKPYSQEHNKMTNKYAGSGLGLAIVKNLVELMNGTLTVKSEEGKGTTFTIFLAFSYRKKLADGEENRSGNNDRTQWKNRLNGKHILLCEDHPLNAEIAQRLLEAAGCTVISAADGKEGVNYFTNTAVGEFDAILMDIRMPVMNGLEASEAIRALDRSDAKTIPIIAMTANAYDSDKENCRRAGMNAHLAKPIDVEELYRTLGTCIT
ncbi:MAG: ATP-binding protein, partial [Lachnospiraceae bacterium]|nr:ATP-binding protein [Lachnospiraceae bacterium]